MIQISFLFRRFRRSAAPDLLTGPPEDPAATSADAVALDPDGRPMTAPPPPASDPGPPPTAVACPYCAVPLSPPPTRARSCPHCRRPIAVRRYEGRIVLLAADAVAVFDAQRQLEADEARWTTERRAWLARASTLGASSQRRTRLASAPISAQVVEESRALYLASADASVRAAKTAKRWKVVSRIRRSQAANLYEEAGRPVPPPDDVIALHREGLLAELRALQSTSKFAELASAGCCPACRQDDGRSVPIAAELRTPRLPHAGCPKGLCGCDWFIAKAPPPKRRRRRATPAT